MNIRDKYEIEINYREKEVVWRGGRQIIVEKFNDKSSIDDAVDRVINKIRVKV